MIGNAPTIMNAPTIYQTGGGGSTFDVDIGGGVKQTLVFPPYLQPIEYIDTSNISEDHYFGLIMAAQIQGQAAANDYVIKCAFSPNENAIQSNERRTIFTYTAPYMYGDTYKEISVIVTKDGTKNTIIPVFGTFSPWLENFDFSKKFEVVIDVPSNEVRIYNDGTLNRSQTMNATPPSYNLGQVMLMNYQNIDKRVFKGKYFYTYIIDSSNNKIISLLIPARAKAPTDTKPYIVDCVSGAVAINSGLNLNVSGIVFGPEIDLNNIQQYFE